MTADAPDTYTLQTKQLPPHGFKLTAGHLFWLEIQPAASRATPPEVAAIEAGLRAMIAQIDADRKARPVHAAIEATRKAYRSDGQPSRYYDPLLKD
jgi:hypothetical protein